MITRYYYAEVLNNIYAFHNKQERDYFVLLHAHLGGHSVYKKDVLKKLGNKLTYSWHGSQATVVSTPDNF